MKPTYEELEQQVLELSVQLANAESKCSELAAVVAENVALKNPDNWLSQSDYGYEASEVATQNGATDDESLRAGMIAIINRIETPATETILAGVRSEVIEWLDAEISAIDPVYRGDPRDVQFFSSDKQTGNYHPTQKPLALVQYLIETYSNPGDTVLDFTMGSGTAGVACQQTGRNFIGIEKDVTIFQTACQRMGIKQEYAA